MKASHYFFIFLLAPLPITPELNFNFVVWNVGQGSWSLLILESDCVHFDMGGETLPIRDVAKICKKKKNWILLSHEDWDHISGIRIFKKYVRDICLHHPSELTKPWLLKMKKCSLQLPHPVQMVYSGLKSHSRNGNSIVYRIGHEVLIPGDSTMAAEKIWRHKVNRKIKGLLLGHHGSKTSTSLELLQTLSPAWAVVSARAAKYGHPHPDVLQKLHKKRVSVYSTETLGHIFFKLKIKSSARKAYIPSPNRMQQLHKSQNRHKH